MLSATLFIRPENLSLQQSTINLHACLSLGAEPSCSRFPIEPLQVSVKLNRFPPTLPQSGALINVWGTAVVTGAIKKPLTTAFGSHPLSSLRGLNACVSGFIWLCATTTACLLWGFLRLVNRGAINPPTVRLFALIVFELGLLSNSCQSIEPFG